MLKRADQRILIEHHAKDEKKKHKHKHQHHHHHNGGGLKGEDLYGDSGSWCIWLFFIFVVLVIVIWVVFAFVYPYEPYGPYGPWPYGPDDKTSAATDAGGPFVFRNTHNFAPKRARNVCASGVAGEVWDADLGMCTPKFNAPLALEHAIMNVTVPACSSFEQTMCGKWTSHHVNEDRSFSYAYHRNQRRLESLIVGTPVLAQFHRSCVELSYPVALKESELEFRHVMEMVVGDLKSYGDLPSSFGRLARYGYGGPFVLSIERHPLEARMIPLFAMDDTFRNFTSAHLVGVFARTHHLHHYDSRTQLDKVRRALKVLNALNEHGPQDPSNDGSYEDYLQGGGFARDTMRFSELPPWSVPYPDSDANGWHNYLNSLDGTGLRFAGAQTIWQLGRLDWLLQHGLPSMELLDWRAYLEFSIIYHCTQFVPLLPNNAFFRAWEVAGPLASIGEAEEAEYRFHHRIPRANLSLTTPTPAQCTAITQHLMPGLVAAAHAAQGAAPLACETARKMAAAMVEQYKRLVSATPWLTDVAAKEAALEKLATLRVRVAEPDEWEPEPFGARISADRWDHNLNLIRRYRVQRNLQQWHKDVADKAVALYGMPLSDVGAYYSPVQNALIVAPGLLQKPFYDAAYDAVSLYALLGTVMGRELARVLDVHGLRWNAKGEFQLRSIYGNDTASMAGFGTALRAVVNDFTAAAMAVPPLVGCNASHHHLYDYAAANEDMADLLGVRLAYHALFDNSPELGQGHKQHFFMIFAQTWCSVYDGAHRCEALAHGEHAHPPVYQVDKALRNNEDFHRDFACHASNAMFKAAESRIKVYG